MLTFLGVAFAIYGAMHFYALSKVWLALPHSVWLAAALSLWGLAMTLSPFILWQIVRQNWHSAAAFISWGIYLWMGFLFIFCCTALLADFVRLLAALSGFKWPPNATMDLVYAGILSLSLLGYGFISARQIQLEEIKISTPKLSPAIGKVTIAQISDLHLSVMLGDEFLQGILTRLREIQPDIIVATGDIVDGQGDDFNSLAEPFQTLRPPGGLFAVIGNHEYFAGVENSLRFLRNAGFTVLRGGAAAAAGGIILVGVDDTSADRGLRKETPAARRDTLAFSKEDFIVLLKHQPVANAETPFDLQLSGHIHGGQIFPFGLIPWLTYGVRTGLSRLADGRWLYVSRGTGTWGPPVRLFAAPEITLITIVSEK